MMVDRSKKFEWRRGDVKFKDASGNPIDIDKEPEEEPTGKDVVPKPLKEEKEA